jgi:hypothetical protein
MRRLITLAAATAVLLAATAAFAASGTDPRDTKAGLDIKSSSIKVVTLDSGHKQIRIAVETYEAFDLSNGVGSFYWQVDAFGGASMDYEVYMFGDPKAEPAQPAFCLVKSTNPDVIYKAYVKASTTATRFVCSVPRHDLRMTKDVRWRVAGRLKGVIDRAPDSGWYSS